jgi:Xaa-Pro aminopeptidase
MGDVTSEEQKKSENRARPTTDEFRAFVATGWAPRSTAPPERAEAAPYAAERRAAVSAQFPGERLVVPAGGLKVRSNDTDYVFRPHSAFAHLTGLGSDREPDAVLVLEPRDSADGGGHDAVLFFRPLAGRDTDEFFGDARYGEFWVGARPTIEDVEAELGVTARHIDELRDALAKDAGVVRVRVVRDADPQVAALVDAVREESGASEVQDDRSDTAAGATATSETGAAAVAETAGESVEQQKSPDEELASFLSHLRMIKDEWEVEQMRSAIEGTHRGFEAVIAQLEEAVRRGRGERWVEGVFGLHARHHGNGVGYDSICASGDHANTLHWIKNTGEIREGDLLLLDAGVEVDSLYTADITRTLPVSGTFTEAQRKIYDAVFAAQEAGIAAAKPGNKFSDIHAAAIRVIAEHLHAWGLLPEGIDVEATLDTEHGQYHRRWMVHGTSHHLGIDVHDCALATRADYTDAELKPGMILTVEPGLYFKADDELAPAEFRGNGVRIEDDILITEDGCENLSAAMPRTADEVEAWIARVRAGQKP